MRRILSRKKILSIFNLLSFIADVNDDIITLESHYLSLFMMCKLFSDINVAIQEHFHFLVVYLKSDVVNDDM